MSTSAGDFELMDRRSPAQTMTSEPVHGQITFRGNFSIPALPKAFANTREKGRKGKKKKRRRLGSRRVSFHKDGSVCRSSVDELRTRHQLITNHDTANVHVLHLPGEPPPPTTRGTSSANITLEPLNLA